MNEEQPPDLAAVAGRFGALLHAAGLAVTAERSGRLAAVMAMATPLTVDEMYWAARVTLVGDHDHLEIFDRVFAQVFGGFVDPADFRGDRPEAASTSMTEVQTGSPQPDPPPRAGEQLESAPRAAVLSDSSDPRNDDPERESLLAARSADERLRTKDFGSLSAEELARLRTLSARMAFATPPRPARRQTRSPSGTRLDVRATLRRSRRSGGEPLVAVRRRRRIRPRRLVLICDISGSMESYARAYLQLLMSGVGGARAEAFVFATRLTRLTRALRATNPELALEQAGRAAPDWSGGTRIGQAIKAFNDSYGQRGMARGAVVVILSDGWDRGDPALLAAEMARLHRLCFRLIWVNPRKARPSYEPLTAGMAGALPHVDSFLSGHSLTAFEEVLEVIAR